MDKGIKNIVIWFFQLLCGGILLVTSWAKLSGQPVDIRLFTELGMEPTGRYLIGVIEGMAAIFLFTHRLAATGGVLALGTMLGALLAHLSILGFNGENAAMWSTVMISSLIVTIARRRHLPLIGSTFED